MKLKFVYKMFTVCYFFLNRVSLAKFIVKIDQGYLNGTTFETRHRIISAFLGIPYAQPPVGDLRFKNPLPAEGWVGIRSAHKAENSCIQMSFDGLILGEEDCLYLNVFTPFLDFKSPVKHKLLPVMVYIHGGGFSHESSDPKSYGPKYLLDKDIVLVSMNYRLGIFGFFTTGDSAAPGNFGMKDQVLALKWVQKNIRHFGGNPKRVTIFGNSAGGACVNLHAISDLTHGLFHQYIIQSGNVLGPWVYRSKEKYKPYRNEVAKNVGCIKKTSQLLVRCLRNKSVEALLKAKPAYLEISPNVIWVPTDESESKDAFLTDSPRNLISQNKMKDQPFISGAVVDEGLLVTLKMYAQETPIEEIKYFLKRCMDVTSNFYVKPHDLNKFTKIIENYYFNKSINSVSKDKLLKNYTTFYSDSVFLYPQITLMEKMLKQSKNPFYFYSFGYLSLNMSSFVNLFDFKKNVGVPHGQELGYLFFKNTASKVSKKDEKILNLMVDLWTSFAINGKPSSNQLEDPYLWQPYVKDKSFLQIGNILDNTDPTISMNRNYFSPRMDFWRKQFPISI